MIYRDMINIMWLVKVLSLKDNIAMGPTSKNWLPGCDNNSYPKPMDHKLAVQRAKEAFNLIKR